MCSAVLLTLTQHISCSEPTQQHLSACNTRLVSIRKLNDKAARVSAGVIGTVEQLADGPPAYDSEPASVMAEADEYVQKQKCQYLSGHLSIEH